MPDYLSTLCISAIMSALAYYGGLKHGFRTGFYAGTIAAANRIVELTSQFAKAKRHCSCPECVAKRTQEKQG